MLCSFQDILCLRGRGGGYGGHTMNLNNAEVQMSCQEGVMDELLPFRALPSKTVLDLKVRLTHKQTHKHTHTGMLGLHQINK